MFVIYYSRISKRMFWGTLVPWHVKQVLHKNSIHDQLSLGKIGFHKLDKVL